MAIFEKKVIIGSVVGFAASAVGVIAVFFPSVFNLEKKSITEKKIFLHTLESANDFSKWLKKEENNIVKLELSYCSGKQDSYYDGFEYIHFGEKINDKYSEYPFALMADDSQSAESGVVSRTEGGFSFPTDELRKFGIETVVWIESHEKDADYEWYVNTRSSDEAEKTCTALGQGAEILRGTFYVNSSEFSSNGIRQGGEAEMIELVPMSKRALQLKNY